MKKILLAVLLIFIFAISTSLAYGGTNMYLKLTGIDGEVTTHPYRNWSEVMAWGWDINHSSVEASRPGTASTKPAVGPIYIQKYADTASPSLFRIALNSDIIDEAKLALVYDDDLAREYVRITMTDVRIISIQSGVESIDGRMMESVALDFSRVCYSYRDPQGAVIDICWDIEKNQESY